MAAVSIDNRDVGDIAEEGHYAVEFADFVLDIYIRPRGRQTAMIFSPGFIDRLSFPHPYFQRLSWFDSFESFGICLADPTLSIDPEIGVGWFAGTAATHYLPAVAAFLDRLLTERGIAPSARLFFGSSAGGFASLAFAGLTPGACAFAVNPQTDLRRFHSFRDLDRLGRFCLGSTNSEVWQARSLPRIHLATILRQAGRVPRSLIWQNTQDPYHVEHHLLPFLTEAAGLPGQNSMTVEFDANAELGHNPPGLVYLKPRFDRILSDWLVA